jgi:hypothetical protein
MFGLIVSKYGKKMDYVYEEIKNELHDLWPRTSTYIKAMKI